MKRKIIAVISGAVILIIATGNIDGEMIEITKEVAYAMNNFYRSSK